MSDGHPKNECLVAICPFLDENVIFSRTPADHIDHVRQVLTLVYDAGITLKLKKCEFFKNHTDYIDHATRRGHLQVSERTTDAIHGLEYPTTVTERRSILRLCNVFPRFVPNFTRIPALLSRKLRNGQLQAF